MGAGFRNLPFKIATLEGVFSKTNFESTTALSRRGNETSRSPLEMESSHKRPRTPSFAAFHERPSARLDIYRLLVNEQGERVDIRSPPVSQRDFDDLDQYIHRQGKYPCEKYHLLGTCNADRCEYSHDGMSKRELHALASLARDKICRITVACRDPTCIYSHNCRHDPGCRDGNMCKNANLHGISKTPLKRQNRSPSPKRSKWEH